MGQFSIDRDALDAATAAGNDRMAVLLDGAAPAAAPAPAAAIVAPAATVQAPTGEAAPGFWSRLGSGLSDLAGKAVEAAKRVEFTPAPISGRTGNAIAQLEAIPAPARPQWGMILAAVAGLVLLVAILRRS